MSTKDRKFFSRLGGKNFEKICSNLFLFSAVTILCVILLTRYHYLSFGVAEVVFLVLAPVGLWALFFSLASDYAKTIGLIPRSATFEEEKEHLGLLGVIIIFVWAILMSAISIRSYLFYSHDCPSEKRHQMFVLDLDECKQR